MDKRKQNILFDYFDLKFNFLIQPQQQQQQQRHDQNHQLIELFEIY